MKDGIKRMINGLEDENLGVFGSLRESKRKGQPSVSDSNSTPWSIELVERNAEVDTNAIRRLKRETSSLV